ncbi:hypothetical protein EVAR_18995_1 [Eumeta japonica]|uniref:Uncharacterized protein n=1 Tax=Eumeta variegata TaxID=151549 RepID=A0A4C1V9I6_EUMVA|nr:hypothetical protein EVAR_18995_1 [Eumeta japonica]
MKATLQALSVWAFISCENDATKNNCSVKGLFARPRAPQARKFHPATTFDNFNRKLRRARRSRQCEGLFQFHPEWPGKKLRRLVVTASFIKLSGRDPPGLSVELAPAATSGRPPQPRDFNGPVINAEEINKDRMMRSWGCTMGEPFFICLMYQMAVYLAVCASQLAPSYKYENSVAGPQEWTLSEEGQFSFLIYFEEKELRVKCQRTNSELILSRAQRRDQSGQRPQITLLPRE